MTVTFLPEGTEIPSGGSNYTKFKSGDNKIRILGSAIVGNELWVGGKPLRKPLNMEFTKKELSEADTNSYTGKKKTPTYFWAFPVYNYETAQVEILEVTQKRIMHGIQSYLEDEDYGSDPTKYDLVINRDDESDPVSYSVRAKPPKGMDKDIEAMCAEVVSGINLNALYEGGDPFNSTSDKLTDEIAEGIEDTFPAN